MIKSMAIYTAGVGSGVFLCAFALRKGLPSFYEEFLLVTERALEEPERERLLAEIKFRIIEQEQTLPGLDTSTRRFSTKVARFIAPPPNKKESV